MGAFRGLQRDSVGFRCGDGRAKLGMPNTVPGNRSTMQNASKKHSMTSRQREREREGKRERRQQAA